MDPYASSGQVSDPTTPPTSPEQIALQTSPAPDQDNSVVPASAPQSHAAPTTATGFIRQLPTTIPWWGWLAGGAVIGWAIGSRR